MEYLENQSHHNNIRIDGIPEESDETWEDTESKAKVALESKLNLPFVSSYSHLSPGKLEAKGSNIKGRKDCKARGNVCQRRSCG